MMLQHIAKNPFLPAQITSFKKALRRNCLESLEALCKTFIERQPGHELVSEAKKLAPLLKKSLGKEDLPMDLALQMSEFWRHKPIKSLFEERGNSSLVPLCILKLTRFCCRSSSDPLFNCLLS
jgi:hypothetical protein